MKKGIKKAFSLLLVLSMIFALAACSPDDDDTGKDTNNDTDKDTGNQEETIVLWSIATESDAFHPAYNQAIEDYENDNQGVKIVHETFENESYKTKLKTAVGGNELPDIFFTWGGGFSEPFVESGKVLPLDDYYSAEIQEELPETALNNATYDGVLYGTTFTSPVSMLFYNRAMFEEYGLEAPETWEDLVEVSNTFIDNEITPFGLSVKDSWVLAMFHDALTLKSAGPEKVTSALRKEGQSYNDPDFINSAARLMELVEMGAIIEGATGLSNDEASALFYDGTVPMFVTGSWMAGSIQTDPENPEDFDVAPIPVLNSDNAQITDFMGGASDTFMVSESTDNPDLAADVAFELTKSISKHAYLSGAGIPVWEVDYDDSEVNPLTRKIAEYTANASSFTLWFDTLMSSGDAGEYLDLLQQLYVGNLSPEDFAESMANQLE
ncbi:MAG: extracellular solute-binding protein [Eubacteriales bacterium]